MAPIGSKNGVVWQAHFWCRILWIIWLHYNKRGKEGNPTPKIKIVYIQPRRFYTQTLSLTNTFLHRDFYTQTLLDTDAFTHRRFTHRNFYTQTLSLTNTFLHKDFYTQTLFTYKSFYTQTLLQMFLHTYVFTDRIFYTQTFLHTNTFTHKHFYTQRLLHTDAFTHRSFYTQTLLHGRFIHKHFHTQTLLHTETFTHRRFCRQKLSHTDVLHTDAFTHRRFYTQKLLHTDDLHTDVFTQRNFYTQTLLHTDVFTHRSFYTQALLHTSLYIDAFTHRRVYTQTFLHRCFFIHRRFFWWNLVCAKGLWDKSNRNFTQIEVDRIILCESVARKTCNRNFYLRFRHPNLFSCERLARDDSWEAQNSSKTAQPTISSQPCWTSTIVLYSFQSPQASLCPCANVLRRDMASARPRQASTSIAGFGNTEPPKERES